MKKYNKFISFMIAGYLECSKNPWCIENGTQKWYTIPEFWIKLSIAFIPVFWVVLTVLSN